MQYTTATFQWITQEKVNIQQVAQAIGVSATAIASAMAKERYSYDRDLAHAVLNPIQDAIMQSQRHENILASFDFVNANDNLKDAIPTNWDKVNYVSLNDIGYANIKLQTAIQMIQDAPNTTISALGLSSYVNDYALLAHDLSANTNGVAAKITGLVIQQADLFYTNHNAVGWEAKSEYERDALRVTYFVNGQGKMEKLYEKNIKNPEHLGIYEPKPGENESGGEWTKDNSPTLTQILGVNYAQYTSGTASTGVEPDQSASSQLPNTLPLTYIDPYTVVIKKGDILGRIEFEQNKMGNPITSEDLMKINGLSPGDEKKLQIGQKIIVPDKIGDNLVVDYGDYSLNMNSKNGTFQCTINNQQQNTKTEIGCQLDTATGKYELDVTIKDIMLDQELSSSTIDLGVGYGYQFENGQPTSNTYLDLTNSITSDGTPTIGGGGTATGADNLVLTDGLVQAYFTGGSQDGIHNVAGDIVTDGWMPGAEMLYPDVFAYLNYAAMQSFYTDTPLPSVTDIAGALLANYFMSSYDFLAIDPLVLDLNGDGVKLTSFGEHPVLFDIDHDGGSKEITGWVSKDDGIVVMDLNSNGKIDDVSETFSEYFGGTVGTNGNAGTKPYTNGFAALQSLDSNHDNRFTSADTAWNNVKVWQDANSDGITDVGELRTLNELGITSINLTPSVQSGLVNGGNEVLATGSFVQNGTTKEAQAANFIANPNGSSLTTSGNGTLIRVPDSYDFEIRRRA